MTSIKSQKALVTVFRLELGSELPVRQYFMMLLLNVDEVHLDCILPPVSIKQINWHPVCNHYGLVCYIFTWNWHNIFVLGVLTVELFFLLEPELWTVTSLNMDQKWSLLESWFGIIWNCQPRSDKFWIS